MAMTDREGRDVMGRSVTSHPSQALTPSSRDLKGVRFRRDSIELILIPRDVKV